MCVAREIGGADRRQRGRGVVGMHRAVPHISSTAFRPRFACRWRSTRVQEDGNGTAQGNV
eukprot:scaffold28332_cov138-Isochrysis_galbana.AAC.2